VPHAVTAGEAFVLPAVSAHISLVFREMWETVALPSSQIQVPQLRTGALRSHQGTKLLNATNLDRNSG
jgi:hypothetical protein